MAFEENKHPRDKNGQFTSKGGGASTGSTKSSSSTAKSKPLKYSRETEGLDEFFDVLSPQETANIMGREVDDNGKIYKPKNKDIDEDYERSWGSANDEEIEKIEIDGDYERAMGPAPDPEEFPEDYKKYVENYKKWQKGETSTSKEDEEKERKQAYKLFNLPF